MYRPDDWEGFVRIIGNAHNTRAEDYEAGADAMHKADIEWLISF